MSKALVAVHHGDPISKAKALMRDSGVHHIPVVSGDQLVGMISWADILRVSFSDAFQTDERMVDATLDHSMTIENLMRKTPVSVDASGSIREAAERLSSGEFHALPVVSGGKLVGMVTSTDLIRYLLEQF